MEEIPGERAGALAVRVHAVGGGIFDLQPHSVAPAQVEADAVAGGGLVGRFRHPDKGVEVVEEADFENPAGNCQVEAEDVGAVDGGCVDPPGRVEVAVPVGEYTWERNW